MKKTSSYEICKQVAEIVANSLRPNIILNPQGEGIHLVGNEWMIYYMTGYGPSDLSMVIRIPAGMSDGS